jgi:soluble lytic murein transglycosylase-like protein
VHNEQVSAPVIPAVLSSVDTRESRKGLDHVTAKVHSIVKKYAPKHKNPGLLAEAIVKEAAVQGYDPLFVAAVIKSESTFNATARSNKGAQGLMQIMPATGAWLAEKESMPRGKLTNPGHNLKLGISYLKQLEAEFAGNRVFTLVAYNWGPGHLERAADGKNPQILQ